MTDWDTASPSSLTTSSTPTGDFWTLLLDKDLPEGFYEYRYLVTFVDGSTREVSDPCARYSGEENESSGFVIGGSTSAENVVSPLSVRKPLRDLVVYELHAGDFTDAFRGNRAPLDAITDKLEYFDDLGINALLIEPWTAWKNKDFDWGYAPFQYFAVEYAYANDLNQPTEKISWLKKLISACHAKGIHVIMDGVFNHCDESFPYKAFYLNDADCPYTAQPFGGTFPGLQDLDFNNQCTQDFIRDVCLYWISEFGIDGIRFDNTVNYYVPGNIKGLPELLQSIQDYVDANGQKNFSMTLEHLDMDAANLVNTSAATSYWDNGLFGNCFGQLWSGTITPSYLAVLNNSQYVNGDKIATMYLSNHDHSTVAWQAGSNSLEGAFKWFRTQPHVIALLTSNSTPLIGSGQEFAEDYWIPEDDHGSGRRVRPRPLRWTEVSDSYGSNLHSLYRTLLKLRQAHPALRSPNFYPPTWADWQTQRDQDGFGVDTTTGVVVYHRWGPADDGVQELFYIALNFSGSDQLVTIQFAENGGWSDVLSGNTVTVNNYRLAVTLESNWGHVFFKRSS
jgi:pullulanase/glycogen debranching enzyme